MKNDNMDIRALFLEFFASKQGKLDTKSQAHETNAQSSDTIHASTDSSAQATNSAKSSTQGGHTIYDSMPLVPDDSSLLFTNAGMVQFKDIFTGKIPTPTPPRATSSQLCIRAGGKHNDLENVGYTARHHTLFEMLGNFSFGDYFKREAISFAWEFVTEVLKFDKSLLYVTVHTSDDEAYELWQEHIAPERIKKMGDKDNFWQMGDSGPCGPCSEIYIDQGERYFNGSEDYFGGEGDRFLEIWNLVFMQYEQKDGVRTPLPRPSIDTGMGLERVYALKEGKINNYDTSLFAPLMACIENLTGRKYVRDDEVADSQSHCRPERSEVSKNNAQVCHTEAVAEVSQKSNNRDISVFSKPQYDKKNAHCLPQALAEVSKQESNCHTEGEARSISKHNKEIFRSAQNDNIADLSQKAELLKAQASFRVIADHSRSVAFLLAQGVNFDKEGRGYVLRRILRRAVRHGYLLGLKKPFLYEVVGEVCESMGAHYGYLLERKSAIMEQCKNEEARFFETIEAGMELFNEELQKLMQATSEQSAKSTKKATRIKHIFSGEVAFKLYDTYGFPLDLTQDMLRESGIEVDLEAFDKCMNEQKSRSKKSWKGSGDEVKNGDFNALLSEFGENAFVGYESVSAESKILALLDSGFKRVESLKSGESGWVMLDRTPFYPESGGPIGDKGVINSSVGNHSRNPSAPLHCGAHSSAPHSQGEAITQSTTAHTRILDSKKSGGCGEILAEVVDTKKFFGLNLSQVQVKSELKASETICANVDSNARAEIAKHHSATHLLHLALREILGSHIAQAGSLVESTRLRFDFSHPNALSSEQIEQIQDCVNARIWQGDSQQCEIMPIAQAKAKGACALFGEKYGEEVRVITFGESIELCGGIHTPNTAQIGSFYIVKESGVSSGVRRIEAVCGRAGYEYAKNALNEGKQARLELKSNNIIEAIAKLKQSAKMAKNGGALNGGASGNLSTKTLQAKQVNGITLIVQSIEGADIAELKEAVDNAKNQHGTNGVAVLLASYNDGKILLVAGVKNANIKAGEWVKSVAQSLGGNGGGRDDFAQAGVKMEGVDSHAIESKIKDAINNAKNIVKNTL
ncbi:alanine--tRNA ligase [Helicobacter sp. 23-1048]